LTVDSSPLPFTPRILTPSPPEYLVVAVPSTTPAEIETHFCVQNKAEVTKTVEINSTCFSFKSPSLPYSINTPLPSYISYISTIGNYLQKLTINIESANLVMGTTMSMSFTNSIKATYLSNDYLTPFKITLFKCYDTLCEECTFDTVNELIGSKLCTQCKKGYKIENNGCTENCGDGFIYGKEKCDDNKKGGCKEDCSGNKEGYTCTGGNET
jgi:hypothetical protein